MAAKSPVRHWLDDPATRLFLPVTVFSVTVPSITFVLGGTGLVFRAVVGLCAIGLVLGTVALIDRWWAPHRNILTAPAIGSEGDFRDVAYQVDRLVDLAEWTHANTGAVVICTWLNSERHYGSARRQRRLSAVLETWSARRAEYYPRAELVDL